MAEVKSSETLAEYYSRYKNSVRITAGCRFEASRRLKSKDSASATTIAILSLYPITLSVADLVPAFKELNYTVYIPFVATVASIVVLVLSLLEYAKQYSVRAAQMQQCGQELNEIYYELDHLIASNLIDPDSFKAIRTRYDNIINKYPENHTQKDFHYYRATHDKKVRDKGFRAYGYIAWHKSWHLIERWGVYALVVLTPPAIVVLTK